MNTNRIEITQEQADAIERDYPMHETVAALIGRADAATALPVQAGVSAEEKVAILALPCMNVDHCGGVA